MNNFDSTVSLILSENWRSMAAAGLIGAASLAGGNTARADNTAITQPVKASVNMDTLLNALEIVESNGKKNAIGDNGKAKGILQIWDVVVQDVNRVYKTTYVHDDAFDPVKARDIAKKYLTFWGKRYNVNTGEEPTYEVLARIWNGGPKGYRKDATIKYWNKVKSYL